MHMRHLPLPSTRAAFFDFEAMGMHRIKELFFGRHGNTFFGRHGKIVPAVMEFFFPAVMFFFATVMENSFRPSRKNVSNVMGNCFRPCWKISFQKYEFAWFENIKCSANEGGKSTFTEKHSLKNVALHKPLQIQRHNYNCERSELSYSGK